MAVNNLNPAAVPPTASEIATAVAAPSASTIATAVAAAVPTTAGITSIVQANAGSPFGGTWTNLGYVSGNGVSTVTFTGLSSYKYFKLYIARVNVATTSGSWFLRVNGDASSSYFYSGFTASGYVSQGAAYGGPGDQWDFGAASANNSNVTGTIEFSQSNGSAYKFGKTNLRLYDGSYASTYQWDLFWANTSAISSLTFFNSAGTNMSNATPRGFYLMGAN